MAEVEHEQSSNAIIDTDTDPPLPALLDECQAPPQGLSWCDESAPLEFDAETFPELKRDYHHNRNHEKSNNSRNSIIINRNCESITSTSSAAKNSSEDDLLQHINVSNIIGDADQSSEDITLDMTIPSEKVGLVIGRGGKTIKTLQEKSGSKMNIIQATPFYEDYDKTLRLGPGPPDLVEHARQLVVDLISKTPGYQGQFKHHKNEYERSPTGGRGRYNNSNNNNNNYNNGGGAGARFKSVRFPVPKVSVGLIIGKGGETIKRIRAETGAKVQFDPINANVGEMDEQAAIVSGKPDQIRHACDLIDELVDTAMNGPKKDRDGTGRRSYCHNNSSTFYNDDHHPHHHHHQIVDQNQSQRDCFELEGEEEEEERVNVPSAKVKLVIGKGRESIRNIVAQSGAQCEIDRAVPPDSVEKTFILKGSRQQVDLAKEMILDKINPRPSKRHQRSRGHHQQHPRTGSDHNNNNNYGGDYRQNNEWGQGDPGAPTWTAPDPYYGPAQTQQRHDRHFIASNQPQNQDYGYSQWLEYFQPEQQQRQQQQVDLDNELILDKINPLPSKCPYVERDSIPLRLYERQDKAQADAWEQQVKAEQEGSDPSPQQQPPPQPLIDIDTDDPSKNGMIHPHHHPQEEQSSEGQSQMIGQHGGPPGFSPRPGHLPVVIDYGQNWSDQQLQQPQQQQQQENEQQDRPLNNNEENSEEEDLDNFRNAQGDHPNNNLNVTQYNAEGPSSSSSSEEGPNNNGGQHHHQQQQHHHQIFMRPPPGLGDPHGQSQGQCPHMVHVTGGAIVPQNGQREPPPNIIQMNNGQGQIVMDGPPPCYPAFAYYYGHPVPPPPNIFPAATAAIQPHHHQPHHHPINLQPAGPPPPGIIPGIQLPPLPPPTSSGGGPQPARSCTRIVTLFYDINCNSIVVLNQWHFS